MEPSGKFDGHVQALEELLDGMIGVTHYSKLAANYNFNHNACWYLPGCWRSDQGLKNDLELVRRIASDRVDQIVKTVNHNEAVDITLGINILERVKTCVKSAHMQFSEKSSLAQDIKVYEELQFEMIACTVDMAIKNLSIQHQKYLLLANDRLKQTEQVAQLDIAAGEFITKTSETKIVDTDKNMLPAVASSTDSKTLPAPIKNAISKKILCVERSSPKPFVSEEYEHLGFKLKQELSSGSQRVFSKLEQNLIIQFKFPSNLHDAVSSAWNEYKRAREEYMLVYRTYERCQDKHELAKMEQKNSLPAPQELSPIAARGSRGPPPPPASMRGGATRGAGAPPPPLRGGGFRGNTGNCMPSLKEEHQVICALSLAVTQLDSKTKSEKECYTSLCKFLFDSFQDDEQYSDDDLDQAVRKYLLDIEKLKSLPVSKAISLPQSRSRPGLETPVRRTQSPVEKALKEIALSQKEVITFENSLKKACEKNNLNEVLKCQEALKGAFDGWKSKIDLLLQAIDKNSSLQLAELKKLKQRLNVADKPASPKDIRLLGEGHHPGGQNVNPSYEPVGDKIEDLRLDVLKLEQQYTTTFQELGKQFITFQDTYESEWRRLKVYLSI